jgi:hypothetical protein
MPEMKAMEFKDKLNLQPVTTEGGRNPDSGPPTGGTPTEKLW